MRGGETDMFGNLVQSAALVGVGAYAARNPNTPGMGIVANIGKFFLYAIGAVFLLFALLLVYILVFGKPATAEKLTMQCRPEDKPQDRNGQAGCITGSGNWYASSTS
jgi:hypothetical protein